MMATLLRARLANLAVHSRLRGSLLSSKSRVILPTSAQDVYDHLQGRRFRTAYDYWEDELEDECQPEKIEDLARYDDGEYLPIAIGQLFKDGRYEITHKLGHGWNSTAWLARDHRTRQLVALKFFSYQASKPSNQSSI